MTWNGGITVSARCFLFPPLSGSDGNLQSPPSPSSAGPSSLHTIQNCRGWYKRRRTWRPVDPWPQCLGIYDQFVGGEMIRGYVRETDMSVLEAWLREVWVSFPDQCICVWTEFSTGSTLAFCKLKFGRDGYPSCFIWTIFGLTCVCDGVGGLCYPHIPSIHSIIDSFGVFALV